MLISRCDGMRMIKDGLVLRRMSAPIREGPDRDADGSPLAGRRVRPPMCTRLVLNAYPAAGMDRHHVRFGTPPSRAEGSPDSRNIENDVAKVGGEEFTSATSKEPTNAI
jgi:hypothetical protein